MPSRLQRFLVALLIELTCMALLSVGAGVGVAHWGATGHETIAASIAGAMAGGVLGNVMDRILHGSAEGLGSLLLRERLSKHLPANHHVARALWDALLSAVTVLAHEAVEVERRNSEAQDRTAWTAVARAERFRRDIGRWTRNRRRHLQRGTLEAVACTAVALMSEDLAALVRAGETGAEVPWSRSAALELASLIGADFAKIGTVPPPAAFVSALQDDPESGYDFGLGQAGSRFFLERVKTDPVVYRALALELQVEAFVPRARRKQRPSRPAAALLAPEWPARLGDPG